MTKLTELRSKAFHHQQGRCFYCSQFMWQHEFQRDRLAQICGIAGCALDALQCTAEHLQARCNGGRDLPKNIVAACRHCNGHRHMGGTEALPPRKYRALVRGKVSKKEWHPAAVL